jgi:hypothetical protein
MTVICTINVYHSLPVTLALATRVNYDRKVRYKFKCTFTNVTRLYYRIWPQYGTHSRNSVFDKNLKNLDNYKVAVVFASSA